MEILPLLFMTIFLVTSYSIGANSQTEGSNVNTHTQSSNQTENGGNTQNLDQTGAANDTLFGHNNASEADNGTDFFEQYEELYFSPEYLVPDLIEECRLQNMSTDVLMGDTPEKLMVLDALCEGVRVKRCIKENRTEAECPPKTEYMKCVYQPKQLIEKYGGLGCYTQCVLMPCENLGNNEEDTQEQRTNETTQRTNETTQRTNETMLSSNQTETSLDLEHEGAVYRAKEYFIMFRHILEPMQQNGTSSTGDGNETATNAQAGGTGNFTNAQESGNENATNTQTRAIVGNDNPPS